METTISAIPKIPEGRISRTCHVSAGSYPNVRFNDTSTCSWLGSKAGAGAEAGTGSAFCGLPAAWAASVFLGAGPCATATAPNKKAKLNKKMLEAARAFCRRLIVIRYPILDFRFLSDRKTASQAKGLGGNFQSGRCLLALVFIALDHAHHVAHQLYVVATVRRNLLGGAVVFHIVVKNIVQDFVWRQCITVFLAGPQFR